MAKISKKTEKERMEEFLKQNENTKMELFKKINQIETVVPIDMNLHFYGLLNWDIFQQMFTAEVKEWVIDDVERRITQWINSHFEEEHFTGQIGLYNHYTVLDRLYEKKKVVTSKHVIVFKDNAVTSFKNIDFNVIDYK